MPDFEKIYFIKEFIKGYASIVALFLSSKNNRFKIISQKDVKSDMILGLTFFSINTYPILKKFRNTFPKNKIIVGGIGVYNSYHRILNYVDFVYFGEAFIFSYESILSRKYEKKWVKINRQIDYSSLPLVKIGKNNYYFLIETGCPFRCEYCMVSWVNKYQKIKNYKFKQQIKQIDKKMKNKHIVFIGNEGLVKERNKDIFLQCRNNKYDNQSITLHNYFKNYNLYKDQMIVRFGIELPSEKLRFKKLPKIKQIKDDDLYKLMTEKYNSIVQLFYIWNYIDTREDDYLEIFNILKYKKNFLLRLNFTTLEIQPYTPLSSKVAEHIDQLKEMDDFRDSRAIDKLRKISKIKIYPAKSNKGLMRWYLFTYTNRKLRRNLGNDDIEEIQKKANQMKIKDDYVNIIN